MNNNIVEAKYSEQIISEYMGNPLIEALPDIIDDPMKMARELTRYPNYNKNDLNLPAVYRTHMVKNLEDYFKPLSMHYLSEQIISRLIRHGYVSRNPYIFKETTIEYVWQKYPSQCSAPSVAPQLGFFGISGIGKTMLIKKILSLYPQVIRHTNYKGDKTLRYQITWLHVETPANTTPRGLCLNLLYKLDELLEGSTYYKKAIGKKASELPNYLKTVLDLHYVGVIVFDELQNIRGLKGKNQEQIIDLLVEISNTVNVPTILIGTLKAIPLFNTEFRNGRRICGDEIPTIWNQIEKDEEWIAFIREMFKFQYTKNYVDFNEELSDLMYEESQGITDIVVKLFMLAQYRAISTGREKITKGVISAVAKDCLKPIRPMLNALKAHNEKALEKYQDVYISKDAWNAILKSEESKTISYIKNNENENPYPTNNQIISIASWLIQGGFEIQESTFAASEVHNKYDPNTDINLLKKYAYEMVSNKKTLKKEQRNVGKKDNIEEPSCVCQLKS